MFVIPNFGHEHIIFLAQFQKMPRWPIFWLTRCPNFDWCNSLRPWNPAHRPYVQWEILPGWWMLLEIMNHMNHTENWGCWRWCKQTDLDIRYIWRCVRNVFPAVPYHGPLAIQHVQWLHCSQAAERLQSFARRRAPLLFAPWTGENTFCCTKISVQIRYLHTGTFVSSVSFTAKNRHLLELLALSAADEGQVDLDNPRQS